MKSTRQQLDSRGYISDKDIVPFIHLSMNECIDLLNSEDPRKRTVATKLLASFPNDKTIKIISDKLSFENKLYPKIEMCKTLASFGDKSSKILCDMLGKIGSNQHKSIPEKEFLKKSYPLPRDIAARTLAGMGLDVLPELINILKTDNATAIREAIDSIGYICFYTKTQKPFKDMIQCLKKNHNDTIIRWKIVRALSAFNNQTSTDLLRKIISEDPEEKIRKEAMRSLTFISSHIET